MRTTSGRGSRAGFSLVEMAMGVMILLILIGSLMQSVLSLSRATVLENVSTELQSQGERAQRAILDDLKRSGFTAVGGIAFPYVEFVNGNVLNNNYIASAHVPPIHAAQPGDTDFGPNREIVFVQPQDANGDRRPDIAANGQMIWSPAQWSYVVVTRGDGVNVLERRLNGATTKKVAHHVERITFDDYTTSGFQVPLLAIRVRIWLRQADARGEVHRFFTEAVVRLRNG